jgi:hypothetical protein
MVVNKVLSRKLNGVVKRQIQIIFYNYLKNDVFLIYNKSLFYIDTTYWKNSCKQGFWEED